MKGSSEKIVIVGYGWVGQANALSLSLLGNDVTYFDVSEKIDHHYITDYAAEYEKVPRIDSVLECDSENTWYIVCVGDKVSEEGVQDLSLIKKALDSLSNVKGSVVLRSTIIPSSLKDLSFDYYLPEFLHEKYAVEESIDPYYFVLGSRKQGTLRSELPQFLKKWEQRAHKTFFGTPEQASYIKYLSNIWNATRIAFVNEFGSAISEPETQEQVKEIQNVVDFIFEKKSYLRYGRSYGGHCLPKDMRAFLYAHESEGKQLALIRGAHTANDLQQAREQKYQTLPMWLSGWKYQYSGIKSFWKSFNDIPFVKVIRKNLRFVNTVLNKILPEPSVADLKRVWEKRTAQYIKRLAAKGDVQGSLSQEDGYKDYKKYIEEDVFLRELLGEIHKKEVLYLGFGTGRIGSYFNKDFGKVYGIDISEPAIVYAEEKLKGESNISLKVNDGSTIPFDSESFDFVFSYAMFPHIPSQKIIDSYIREIYRSLKKGAIAKLHFRTGAPPRRWEQTYGVSFSTEELVLSLEKQGFTVLRHEVEQQKNLWVTIQK